LLNELEHGLKVHPNPMEVDYDDEDYPGAGQSRGNDAPRDWDMP